MCVYVCVCVCECVCVCVCVCVCALIQELIDEPPQEAKLRREGILRRLAIYQFTQSKFEESLKNYLEIQESESMNH